MTRHLLVTNDFPPKHGGIQTLLWEWWRRLPADSFAVLTTPFAGSEAWDAAQPYRVVRTTEPWLVPHPGLVRRINSLAAEINAELVVLDPALPLALLGPQLELPYVVVLHGAEVTVPGRLPGLDRLLGHVLRGAAHVIAAGGYPLAEAERAAGATLAATVIPPGVDSDRFVPLDDAERRAARERFDLDPDAPLVVGVSRLVPRKGFDLLIQATALLSRSMPTLQVAIAGDGRDRKRLELLVLDSGAPVHLLGRQPDEAMPAIYGMGDVFAMLCRNRWAGLEQEGFGIVFLEAAAAGVPQVAGRSGGAHEAVAHGVSGLVVDPTSATDIAVALRELLTDGPARDAMAAAGRARAVSEFTYDALASRLSGALATAAATSDAGDAGVRSP